MPTGESESNLEPSEDHTELSDSSDVNERIAATGFHQHIYFYRSIGIAILFAILTYWLSESAFRSPPVDDEPSWEWFGWIAVVEENITQEKMAVQFTNSWLVLLMRWG